MEKSATAEKETLTCLNMLQESSIMTQRATEPWARTFSSSSSSFSFSFSRSTMFIRKARYSPSASTSSFKRDIMSGEEQISKRRGGKSCERSEEKKEEKKRGAKRRRDEKRVKENKKSLE